MSKSKSNSGTGFFVSLLTVAFIVLKLTNYIDWSWWWVLAPLWAPLSLALIIYGIIYVWASWYAEKTIKNWEKDLDEAITGQSETKPNEARKSKFMQKLEEAMAKQQDSKKN